MNSERQVAGGHQPDTHARERRIVNSALWAAAGDALGWITELSRGPAGVAHRVGVAEVRQPVPWRRIIGGRNGVRVDLPAGTYSDDTQLRLSVSRSIRGDGYFDAETFAKIELTVWPTYALGGGLGTKAAAASLARRSVNWFSNFFDNGGLRYVNGGGNGAAMRIQPHVWAAPRNSDKMILDVLRDSLITHGHPQGFCGAIFHAQCVAHALHKGHVPTPEDWRLFIEAFGDVERLISLDQQLFTFWFSAWENNGGAPITSVIDRMRSEALGDLEAVQRALAGGSSDTYHQLLVALGCLTPQYRGAGFKTALAAASLAYLHHGDSGPAAALVLAANELDSDTDTIATMAGSILGAIAHEEPSWKIQDRPYIIEEARRLASISLRHQGDSFTYPDLGRWNPPTNQTSSVGLCDGQLAIAGLGFLKPASDEYRAGDAIWQWLSLPFGQTILAKRKAELKVRLPESHLPGPRQQARLSPDRKGSERPEQSGLPLVAPDKLKPVEPVRGDNRRDVNTSPEGIDAWTDAVIRSEFDDLTLGRMLNSCIDLSGSVEAAIAFSGIVAKAKLTRQRRGR